MKLKNNMRMMLFAIMVGMLLMGASSAFAVQWNEITGDVYTGTEQAPAKVHITKTLRMPGGTVTPTANFGFNVSKVSYNGATDGATLAAMPTISSPQTLSFASGDAGTTAARIKTVTKETADILAGLTFTQPGVYVYRIVENQASYVIADANLEYLRYSQADYEVHIYVRNNAAGTGTFVYAIGCLVDVPDTSSQTHGDKVDASTGAGGMVFTNTYVRTSGSNPPVTPPEVGDPANPATAALIITKATAGASAPSGVDFTFTLGWLVNPLTDAEALANRNPNAAVAYKYNVATGNVISIVDLSSGTFTLKNGEGLAIRQLHVGDNVTVTETGVADWTPQVTRVIGGGAPATTSAGVGASLATAFEPILLPVNSAAFVNTYKEITPTGLDVAMLPYVALLVLAGAAGAVLVVNKRSGKEVV